MGRGRKADVRKKKEERIKLKTQAKRIQGKIREENEG